MAIRTSKLVLIKFTCHTSSVSECDSSPTWATRILAIICYACQLRLIGKHQQGSSFQTAQNATAVRHDDQTRIITHVWKRFEQSNIGFSLASVHRTSTVLLKPAIDCWVKPSCNQAAIYRSFWKIVRPRCYVYWAHDDHLDDVYDSMRHWKRARARYHLAPITVHPAHSRSRLAARFDRHECALPTYNHLSIYAYNFAVAES